MIDEVCLEREAAVRAETSTSTALKPSRLRSAPWTFAMQFTASVLSDSARSTASASP